MWNTAVNYQPTDFLNAARLNGVGNDLRAHGGDVNAAGYNLTNVGNLYVNGLAQIGTGSSGVLYLSTAASAPFLAFGLTAGKYTFGDNNGVYLSIDPAVPGIGINNANPATALDVNGVVTLRPAATPPNPSSSSEGRYYIKGGKLVLQYNDTGTTRYKYLDLTGTGVTWVHTTSAP